MAAQLMNALFAPDQMVDFLFGGVIHGGAHLRQLGGQGLTLIQRLGADFAGMVDAHQTGDVSGVLVPSAPRWSRSAGCPIWPRSPRSGATASPPWP